MPILGAALRAELVDALGLRALRKDLLATLHGLAREMKAVRTVLREGTLAIGRRSATGALPQTELIASAEIRAARQSLGDSRKAFAQRLGVSPGIVFAWESGRSVPRRKAIVARLQRLLATRPARSSPVLQRSSRSGSGSTEKRVLKLSGKRRAALKVQGQYMGFLRSLEPSQRAQVKKVKAASGFPAAIKLARKLRRA
jgi:DNA-binding transcriptional regulator YiaG